MSYDIDKWTANDVARRSRRRHWALAILVGMAIALVNPVIQIVEPVHRTGSNSFMGLLPLLLLTMQSPFARDSWLSARRLALFDEFERNALMMATRRAYSVMLGIVAVLLVWLELAIRLDWPMPTEPRQWAAIGIGLIGIAMTLPVLFAELLVPFPPEGDEDDML